MRSTSRSIFTTMLALALLCTTAQPVQAAPSSSSATSETVSTPSLNAARDRAIELETQIDDLRGEQVALEGRLDVTNQRIFRQQELLAYARQDLEQARSKYRDRMIRMYKSQLVDPVSILISSESIADLYTRIMWLSRISQRDHAAYEDAIVAASEAEYQAAYLDELKSQDVQLRQIQALQLATLDQALTEQRELVDRLTTEALAELRAVQTANTLTRKEWLNSSIPVGDQIPMAQATVSPHEGIVYTVPEYQPKSYRSLGKTQTMVCSWYGNEFNGRATASGQIFNEEDLTCASRTLPFGTRLALSRGNLRIIVVVNDRGPFVDGRDLDLSKAAARLLGFSGVEPVQAEFVEAAE